MRRRVSVLLALAIALGLVAPAVAVAESVATTNGSSVCQTVAYQPPSAGVEHKIPMAFSETLAKQYSLRVTQGWIISPEEEQFVDGGGLHNAIDYEFTSSPTKGFGLPIFLPKAACVYSSYQAFDCDNVVDGKHVGCGAGLFTEAIFDNGWVQQIVHYDVINPKIPFLKTVKDGEHGWFPEGIVTKSSAQLKPQGVRMQAGEVLGLMGESGITFGYYDNFRVVNGRGIYTPRTPAQRAALPNWEDGMAQAHEANYRGRAEGGPRQGNTDPFGWYGQITPTNDPYNGVNGGQFKLKPGVALYQMKPNGHVRYIKP